MQFTKDLLTLCVIAFFCLCVDGAGIVMNLWHRGTAEYRNKPTWHYESTGYFIIGKINQLGFYGLRDMAKRHYDWLKDKGRYDLQRALAFWDPITQTVYASSIPLGPRNPEMKTASSNNGAAPSLYNQVRTIFNTDEEKVAIHAEDGAYYNYETTIIAQAKNGRYPSRSMITIYSKSKDQKPKPIDPCGAGKNARDPLYIAVVYALGVSYALNVIDEALLRA